MMLRETAFATLSRVAKINDRDERAAELRRVCRERPAIAMYIQYVYHPNVAFDLPKGKIEYQRSGEDQYGMFYSQVRKLKNFFTTSPVSKERKLENFIVLLETVTGSDSDLLIAAKDKSLPWNRMGRQFCVEALPELFPQEAS
jgi:hypothetical protein